MNAHTGWLHSTPLSTANATDLSHMMKDLKSDGGGTGWHPDQSLNVGNIFEHLWFSSNYGTSCLVAVTRYQMPEQNSIALLYCIYLSLFYWGHNDWFLKLDSQHLIAWPGMVVLNTFSLDACQEMQSINVAWQTAAYTPDKGKARQGKAKCAYIYI